MSSMRIGMAHSGLVNYGGGERFVLEVSQRLAARNHRITLYTTRYEPATTFSGLANFTRVTFAPWQWPVVTVNEDVVLAHNFLANLLAYRHPHVAYYLHSLRSPYLQGGRRPDLALRRLLERGAVARDQRIIANSRFTAANFQRLYQRPVTDQVYCGIEARLFAVPAVVGNYALFVGRFDPEKGLDRLIDWWQGLDYPLLLVGDGDPAYVEALKQRAGPRVRFLGSTAGEALAQLYQGSRFVVFLPFREDLGIVPLEAMGAAKPVIASDEGGPAETVLDGATGYLVGSADAFRDAAMRLIASEQLCRDLGAAGRRHAQQFSWDATAQAIERIATEMRKRA